MKQGILQICHKFSRGITPNSALKKFYKQSTFTTNTNPASPLHKYIIMLDDKYVYTPHRHVLAVPTVSLAQLIIQQFNQQQKVLNSNQMPILGMSRAAVDADIEGNIALHFKKTIYDFLKTDTLNFYQDYYEQQYNKQARHLVDRFAHDFNMKIKPTSDLEPPQIVASTQFNQWIQSLNNWQLIGLESMTVWLQSIISAYGLVKHGDIDKIVRAANFEELVQIHQSGEVEEKLKMMKYINQMVGNGLKMYRHGK